MEQYHSSSSATTSSSSPSSQRGGGTRELQGPRPAPLRVRTDSHKIRKPPQQPVQQVRKPVIIYAVSPKVVHADPSEFMSVVQRLTGSHSRRTHTATASSSSSVVVPHHISQMPFFGVGQHAPMLPPPAPHFPFQLQEQAAGGAQEMTTQLSPAARLAAIEQASSSRSSGGAGGLLPPFPSVLSPGPLPAIQPSFSPPAGAGSNFLLDGGGINLFGELISPAAPFLGAATGSISTAAGAITGQSLSLQQEASPLSAGAYYWGDLFNNQQHHHQTQNQNQ
ncbi:protein MKS1-like [Panicum virgatum]|uniref:VQ domain-containing protein n=1 Tax=Panicum virgatum TaxID=38727 RepID=A0A8T0QSM1_PANVG|nr:protein MKS1-like [Panicum virgatum]KAG2576094.1 hypothetical protein PVAP13_6NG004831 [Panicum virgatum]